MKTKNLLPLAFGAMLFAANQLSGQTINLVINDIEVEVIKDTVALIKSFTGKHVQGKTYLNWNVANQHVNGTYVIYRSSDGENYEAIGLMDGIGVPVSQPIAYYFTDESYCSGTVSYKVIHFGINNSFLVSDKVSVTSRKEYLSNL